MGIDIDGGFHWCGRRGATCRRPRRPQRETRGDGGDGAVMLVIIGSSDRGARGFRESSSGPSTMDRE